MFTSELCSMFLSVTSLKQKTNLNENLTLSTCLEAFKNSNVDEIDMKSAVIPSIV